MVIPLEKLESLPIVHRATIPESFLDEMGHMNIMYYVHLYDRGAWGLFDWLGITLEEMRERNSGMFALKNHIQYLAEVHVGQTVLIRSRIIGVSAKRLHFMHFMVNETTGVLSSTLENLASYADLNTRRTAFFPDEMHARITTALHQHNQLDWQAPLCGILNA